MEVDKPEYSKKDMWWAITKTATVTFVLAGIFFRFLAVESRQQEVLSNLEEIKVLIDEKNTYTNDRIDKKTSRNKELIEASIADFEKKLNEFEKNHK